jgi:hypothetical protein
MLTTRPPEWLRSPQGGSRAISETSWRSIYQIYPSRWTISKTMVPIRELCSVSIGRYLGRCSLCCNHTSHTSVRLVITAWPRNTIWAGSQSAPRLWKSLDWIQGSAILGEGFALLQNRSEQFYNYSGTGWCYSETTVGRKTLWENTETYS